jgi:hypothetical protein
MRADGASGATVKFRGVKIGSAAQTRILLPPECALCETKSKDLRLPVVLKIEGPHFAPWVEAVPIDEVALRNIPSGFLHLLVYESLARTTA